MTSTLNLFRANSGASPLAISKVSLALKYRVNKVNQRCYYMPVVWIHGIKPWMPTVYILLMSNKLRVNYCYGALSIKCKICYFQPKRQSLNTYSSASYRRIFLESKLEYPRDSYRLELECDLTLIWRKCFVNRAIYTGIYMNVTAHTMNR